MGRADGVGEGGVTKMGALRKVGPAIATAVVASGLAIMVNFATDWRSTWWAWAVVVVLTGLSAMLSTRSEHENTDPEGGSASVSHSVIEGNNVQIGRAGGNVSADGGG